MHLDIGEDGPDRLLGRSAHEHTGLCRERLDRQAAHRVPLQERLQSTPHQTLRSYIQNRKRQHTHTTHTVDVETTLFSYPRSTTFRVEQQLLREERVRY